MACTQLTWGCCLPGLDGTSCARYDYINYLTIYILIWDKKMALHIYFKDKTKLYFYIVFILYHQKNVTFIPPKNCDIYLNNNAKKYFISIKWKNEGLKKSTKYHASDVKKVFAIITNFCTHFLNAFRQYPQKISNIFHSHNDKNLFKRFPLLQTQIFFPESQQVWLITHLT